MKTYIISLLFLLSACSTNMGLYDKDDPENNEFSVANTLLSVVAAAAIVAGGEAMADSFSNNNNYAVDSYAWDWQPGNSMWVCRNKNNGQYSLYEKCSGLSQNDYTWPS